MEKLINILKITILTTMVMGMLCNITACCEETMILRAVPNDASIIIKTTNLAKLTESINSGNPMWEQAKRIPGLKYTNDAVSILDSIITSNSEIRSLLSSKEAVISLHNEGKSKIRLLMSVSLSKGEAERAMVEIKKAAEQASLAFGRYEYDKAKIYAIVSKQNKDDFKLGVSYIDGLLAISTSKLTTEKAVRHIHSKNSITHQQELEMLMKSEGKNAEAVLIVNFSNLNDMISPELSAPTKQIARQAEWGLMDLSINRQSITTAGFVSTKNENGQYLKMLEGQSPIDNEFTRYLPSKTTAFVSLGVKDMSLFTEKYTNYMKESNGYSKMKTANDGVRQSYGVDLSESLYSLFRKRITQFTCDYNLAGRGADKYIVAELDSPEKMEALAKDISAKYNKQTSNAGSYTISSISDKKFTVYVWPFNKMFHTFFSNIFSTEVGYLCIYQGKALFAQSTLGIREYINSMEKHKTLADNSNYAEFSSMVNSRNNLYYYADIAYSNREILSLLSKANADSWKKNTKFMKNFRSMAIQYSYDNANTFYTSGALMYSTIIEDDRYIAWRTPVDTIITQKPHIVKNHNTGDNEVLVQDETNKLYLFNKEGNPIWKKQLGEPIVGKIHQIDYFQNNKLQYLFATENFLYIIDRNGNFMDNYPARLPASLSAEISVFDYENNGTYRIFAPCTNKKLYLYTKEGKHLETWTPVETKDNIITPVQYFNIEGSEYLTCADNLNTYILNRRGEMRINVTNKFAKARNSLFYLDSDGGFVNTKFITTNSSGEIMQINIDGSCRSTKFKNYSANHYFVMKDINGDGQNEYIFTDEDFLDVFSHDGKHIFNIQLDGRIGKPSTFTFGAGDTRIGVTCRSKGKIYLFNNKGETCGGFPMQGSSDFSITKLNNPEKFSVLTGYSENYLYNYQID